MEGLTEDEEAVLDQAGEFLDVLEKTPMTKSYKMLLVMAMLKHDSFPGALEIAVIFGEGGVVQDLGKKLVVRVPGIDRPLIIDAKIQEPFLDPSADSRGLRGGRGRGRRSLGDPL